MTNFKINHSSHLILNYATKLNIILSKCYTNNNTINEYLDEHISMNF